MHRFIEWNQPVKQTVRLAASLSLMLLLTVPAWAALEPLNSSTDASAKTQAIELAADSLRHHNYIEALGQLRQLEKKYPDDATLQEWLGYTHHQLKDYGQALLYYQRAQTLDDSRVSLWVHLGEVWQAMGDYEKAEVALDTAMKRWPNQPAVHTAMADLFQATRKLDRSREAYQTAIELDPMYAPAYFGMGQLYEEAVEYDQALTFYHRYLEVASPSDNRLGQVYAHIERLKSKQQTP